MSNLANMMLFLVGGGVFGVFAVIVVPQWWRQRPSARIARRFAMHVRNARADSLIPTLAFGDAAIFQDEDLSRLDRARRRISNLFANIGGGRALRRLVLLGAGVAVVVLAAALGWLGWDFLVAILAAGGGGLAACVIGYVQMKRRWQIAFLNNLADAIDLVIRAVRSGIPVSEAIRTAGEEINEPVRREFQGISDSIDLGIDLKQALRTAAERIRLPDFDFFVITLVIQRETGGQLAETLEGLALILRRRKELRMKVKAMTAEGRMSAAIVGGMPIVAGVAMYAMDPDHMGRLFEPGTGQTMLYIAVGMMSLGMLVVHQLTKVKP
jgi:tight adherence protein B